MFAWKIDQTEVKLWRKMIKKWPILGLFQGLFDMESDALGWWCLSLHKKFIWTRDLWFPCPWTPWPRRDPCLPGQQFPEHYITRCHESQSPTHLLSGYPCICIVWTLYMYRSHIKVTLYSVEVNGGGTVRNPGL